MKIPMHGPKFMTNSVKFILALTVAAAAAPKLVVRIGYQPTTLVHIVAKEKGWFEEEFAKDGIQVKHDIFPVGPAVVESFASGRTDFGYMADQPAIQGRSNNIDIKAIAVTSITDKSIGLLVSKNSKIRTIKDLRGKKVATAVGSIMHQLLLLYLKSENMTLADIRLVNLVPADLNNALQTGNVDAIVNSDPFNSAAVLDGYARMVKDATGYKNVLNLIIARNAFVKANPQVAARVIKVYARTDEWVATHLDEALTVLVKATGFRREVLRPLLTRFQRGQAFGPVAVKTATETASFLYASHVIRRQVDTKDFLDPTYLRLAGIPTP
jgi:sulfonate transport system substrate-binding protein